MEHLLGILAFRVKNNDMPDDKNIGKNDFYIIIPMEFASVIAFSIINSARAQSGWLGISIPLKETSSENCNGIPIQNIAENSPAALCGLKPMDCIFEYNGLTITTPREMIDSAAKTKPGDTVTIKVFRNGSVMLFNATLIEHPHPK
jgi:S1-C subfamily serine protease